MRWSTSTSTSSAGLRPAKVDPDSRLLLADPASLGAPASGSVLTQATLARRSAGLRPAEVVRLRRTVQFHKILACFGAYPALLGSQAPRLGAVIFIGRCEISRRFSIASEQRKGD